jgi:16S rRNA (cytosine967-C5)-methyltransferase
MQKEFPIRHFKYHATQVFEILKDVFKNGTYADRAIEKVMRKNKMWKVRERSFVADTTYDIIRNWRLLSTVSEIGTELTLKNCWTLFGAYLVYSNQGLPRDPVFKYCSEDKFIAQFKKFQKVRKIRESYSDEMDALCAKELGEKLWEEVAGALNEIPKIFIRVNTLKTTMEELKASLEEQNIETEYVTWSPQALQLNFSRNMFRTPEFKEGLFEVQDAVSQMAAPFLNTAPGMRVIDACAGAGGKSLHLAALMKNKGKVISLDISESKLEELKKRARRAGANIIEPKLIDTTKVVKRMYGTADRLLLDVPCSGLGVLRRNPDAKWKTNVADLERIHEQQRDILERYSNLCKEGGLMVYTTCSILPSEGEEQIRFFTSKHPEWKFISEKRYSPNVFDGDGFYMALLQKKSQESPKTAEEPKKMKSSATQK